MARPSVTRIKPLHYRRSWLTLWLLAIVMVIALSLLPSNNLPQVQVGNDKLHHLLAYAALMFGAVQLFAAPRLLLGIAVLLLLLGGGLEYLQAGMASGRHADWGDMLANTLGVLLGFTSQLTPWRDLLLRIDRTLTGA